MHENIHSTSAGQAAPTLAELAEAIHIARAEAVAVFKDGLRRIRTIGDKLTIAKEMAGHGRWTEFLKACDLNDRTARQYMQFAELAAKMAPGTDLVGMSLKAAIKLLTPPKPAKSSKTETSPKQIAKPEPPISKPGKCTAHIDIIEAWLAAAPADRTKAVDAIGLEAWLAAIPKAWEPLVVAHHATHAATPVTIECAPDVASGAEAPTAGSDHLIPTDLSIPNFLDRRGPTS